MASTLTAPPVVVVAVEAAVAAVAMTGAMIAVAVAR